MKLLERPLLDRIFFAGEHIPVDYFNHGYAHGAALSGRKQASIIMGATSNAFAAFPQGWAFILVGAVCFHFV